MAVFPFPQLAELREKYTYNITPFPTSVKSNGRFVLHLETCQYPQNCLVEFFNTNGTRAGALHQIHEI